jgi:hypothetical protein
MYVTLALIAVAIILLIIDVSNRLPNYYDDVILKKIVVEELFKKYYILQYLLPLSVFIDMALILSK